jgi:hypothetical protein
MGFVQRLQGRRCGALFEVFEVVGEGAELGLPAAKIGDRLVYELCLLGVHEFGDALLGVGEGVGPELFEERLEPHGEECSGLIVTEHEIGEQRKGLPELFGVGCAQLGGDPGRCPWGWGQEEPGHGQIEGSGEGDDLVGVELADAFAVDRAFGGGEAGLGPPDPELGGERLGGLVLGPAFPLAGSGEVVGDDLVRGEPEVERDLSVGSGFLGRLRHGSTLAQTYGSLIDEGTSRL